VVDWYRAVDYLVDLYRTVDGMWFIGTELVMDLGMVGTELLKDLVSWWSG
jgi:hypothetical protein